MSSSTTLPQLVDPAAGREFRRVGFVATRICGTDGVSLEIGKWAEIFQRMGYDCHYITGKSDRPAHQSFLIDEADFQEPEIAELHAQCFGHRTRAIGLSGKIHELRATIKKQLYEAIKAFSLDLLVVQNALTIPLNIPLGTALVEVLAETRMPCIAHHHDFAWERERFLVNCVDDYLRAAFPPRLSQIQHVVINSLAGEEFSRRTGQSYYVIPNVMNFAHGPDPPDKYATDFRSSIGVTDDDLLIIQPTRIVQRKGIEHTIELVRYLRDRKAKLVITHTADDEGPRYHAHLKRFAELMDVEIITADDIVGAERGRLADGRKKYAIWDVYPHADLVAYPSTYEGFGNAFVEAVYYRKPILCNRYTIYRTDIEPLGFHAVVMDGFIDDRVVAEVKSLLDDDEQRERIVEQNYQLARRYFSFERLETELRSVLARIQCCEISHS